MTGQRDPTGGTVRLKLDPEFARYYGLPHVLPFRMPPGTDSGEALLVDIAILARGLETARRHPEAADNPSIRRFLGNWPLIESIDRYLSVGNFTFAARTALELERQDPGLPCAAYALGIAASRAGDLEKAADALEICLAACPGHVPATEEMVSVLALSGAWDGAALLLDRLDSDSPETGGGGLYRDAVEERSAEALQAARDAMTAMGAHGRKDEPDLLLHTIEEATHRSPRNAELHRRAALALRGKGDRVRGRTLAEKAARLAPRSAAAHDTLARLAVETGDLMEAERAAIRARTLAPYWTGPITVLASALRADRRPAHAAAILEEAAKHHPGDMNLRKLQALCLLEAGRPAEARNRLLEVARHDGFDPAAHYNLARASEALRDWNAARDAYRAAIERAPSFAAAREALALLDHREGRTAEARAALEALVQEMPADPHGYRGLGDIHLDTDPKTAARWYEEALEVRSDFACAGLLYLAGLRELLGKRPSEAARLFGEAIRADARRHRAWCNLGVARFEEGKLEEAITAMEEAASLDPGEPGYQENLRVFYRAAFGKNPFRNFRYLGKSRKAAREARTLRRNPVRSAAVTS